MGWVGGRRGGVWGGCVGGWVGVWVGAWEGVWVEGGGGEASPHHHHPPNPHLLPKSEGEAAAVWCDASARTMRHSTAQIGGYARRRRSLRRRELPVKALPAAPSNSVG